MKLFSAFVILLITVISWGQDAAKNFVVPVSAVAVESPASITLSWTENASSGTNYLIFKKIKGANGWGSSIGTVPVGTTVFVDNNVSVGTSYEYLVQKTTGGSLYAWSYINAGIRTELTYNRGDLLLLVDSTHVDSLAMEIAQLEDDLYNDGWMVTTLIIGPSESPQAVKTAIQSQYSSLPDLRAVYLLGHIPVPYSGNLNPDAHPDHQGAWPADVYYGDMDGNWTDVSVNNTVATDVRNHNIPGDGKFDQSKVPSAIELQVCRVDFYDLPAYSENEQALLRNYLNRAHEFKIGAYVPQEKALYDQGGFTGMAEGFAQNGIRNFAPFVGASNVFEIDYFTSLTTESYLWSYGCGAGSYTSAGALDNGTALTTGELAATGMQATFTMVFGSYFGDWDKSNNFMRAILANGQTLSASWAGRPNWHYHTMAQGDNLGAAALISMDKNSDYLSLDLGGGFVTWEGVHVAQLGDPSLRAYYVEPPSNLQVINVNNEANLDWTASTDSGIDGYNIYRRTPNGLWVKLNSSIVVGTLYTDATITSGDNYEFMVKAVKLKTNGSGTFFNESLGSTDAEVFTVGLDEPIAIEIAIYPIPANDQITISSNQAIQTIQLYNVSGQLVYQDAKNQSTVSLDLSTYESGAYVLVVGTENGTYEKRIVKN